MSCPDPNDPSVHYEATNIDECPIEGLVCDRSEYAFHNFCGCGCIDKGSAMCDLDERWHVISTDEAYCEGFAPACPIGQKPFNNSCGCGCLDE